MVLLPRYGDLMHLNREIVQAIDAALQTTLMEESVEIIGHAQRSILAPQISFHCDAACARRALPSLQAHAAIKLILWGTTNGVDTPEEERWGEIDPQAKCVAPTFSEDSSDDSLSNFYVEPSCLYMVGVQIHDSHGNSYSVSQPTMTEHPENYVPPLIRSLLEAFRKGDAPDCEFAEDDPKPCKTTVRNLSFDSLSD